MPPASVSPVLLPSSQRELSWFFALGSAAFLVGLLHLVPSLLIRDAIERSGGFYLLPQLTHPTHSDSVIWYIPASREVADGHLLPSDVLVPENKNLPFMMPPVPLMLFGGLIALTGGPNLAYLTALFIFPVITFFLLYWLARHFFPSRFASLAFALIGTLTPVAVNYLGRTWERFQLAPILTLKGFIPWVRTPIPELYLSRITEPLLTLPFLIIAFGLLWRFWREPTVKRGAAAGLAGAALLYVYLHYFAFFAGFAVMLALAAFVWRRDLGRKPWLVLLAVMAIGTVPFIVNYLELRQLPQAGDFFARWSGAFEQWRGIRLSAWPDYLLYVALAIPLIPLWRKNRTLAMFFAAAIATMFVCWNIQIITGFTIIPTHWRKAFGLPLYTLLAVHIAFAVSYLANHPRWRFGRRPFTVVLAVLLMLLVAKRTLNALAYINPDDRTIAAFSFPKQVYDSWLWMDANLPPEAVVLSDSFVTSLYVAGYTALNPYVLFADLTLIPRADLEQRYLNVSKLFGVPGARLELLFHGKYYAPTACDQNPVCDDEHASRNLLRTPQMLYGGTFDERRNQDQLRLAYDQTISLTVVNNLMARYRVTNPSWGGFKGAYVYYGPWERQINEINFRANRDLELLYDNGTVEIYRVK